MFVLPAHSEFSLLSPVLLLEKEITSRVDEPTPWCAGLVLVPKKSGEVRLNVDLKPLNEAVLREVHPIPGVDDTLAKLSGARVFSKLDANGKYC